MNANIVAYSADPEDMRLSLMIRCDSCRIEWGWCWEGSEQQDKLQSMADEHNAQHHG